MGCGRPRVWVRIEDLRLGRDGPLTGYCARRWQRRWRVPRGLLPKKGSTWGRLQRLIYRCWAISSLLSDLLVANCPFPKQFGLGARRFRVGEVEFECHMVKSLLIVDDDPAQRRILEETIKRLGFETKSASSVEQALH